MKVILLKEVKGLGKTGEIVDIADGYGRNYLLPRDLARVADEKTLKIAAGARQKASKEAKFANQAVEKFMKKLANLPLNFILPTDAKGHLYAGLKDSEISAKIRMGAASLPDDMIKFPDLEPLKRTGEHKVRLKIQDKLVEIKVIIHPVKSSRPVGTPEKRHLTG